MKKTQLIIPSILSIMSFTLSSGKASMIEEHINDFAPQQPLKNIGKDEQPLIASKKLLNSHVFNEVAHYQAIARKYDELTSFNLSLEERSIKNFELAKLHYDLGKNLTDSEERIGCYEQAKFYFKQSKLSEAEVYLVKIAKLNPN